MPICLESALGLQGFSRCLDVLTLLFQLPKERFVEDVTAALEGDGNTREITADLLNVKHGKAYPKVRHAQFKARQRAARWVSQNQSQGASGTIACAGKSFNETVSKSTLGPCDELKLFRAHSKSQPSQQKKMMMVMMERGEQPLQRDRKARGGDRG
jgi:hypothetical protein